MAIRELPLTSPAGGSLLSHSKVKDRVGVEGVLGADLCRGHMLC